MKIARDRSPSTPFLLSMIADCSVCSKDYSPGLGRTCTKCSDSKVGIVLAIVLGALGTAVGVIVTLHVLSEEKEGTGRGIVDRIKRIIPFHTLKIVVVAWQILTQVNIKDAKQYFRTTVSGMQYMIYTWADDLLPPADSYHVELSRCPIMY